MKNYTDLSWKTINKYIIEITSENIGAMSWKTILVCPARPLTNGFIFFPFLSFKDGHDDEVNN